jgi:hypothetical protein
MKIFNIGFWKCGTTSLTIAMKILGFKSTHYRLCADGYNRKAEKLISIMGRNRNSGKKLLNSMESIEFFSDFSGRLFYKDLDIQYPKSKFILTVRNDDDWCSSIKRHRERKRPTKKYGYNIEIENLVKDKYKYIEELETYFKNRENGFLILNICDDPSWEKLCEFVSKPIPKIPFPRGNVDPKKKK